MTPAMPSRLRPFRYTATGPAGQRLEGQILATSRLEALHRLRQQGLSDISCQPLTTPTIHIFPSLLLFRIAPAHLARFFHQLHQLLSAGVGIRQAIETLSTRGLPRQMQAALRRMVPELAAGRPLSELMQAFPQVFPPEAVGLVQAGERTGHLPQICADLDEYYSLLHRGFLALRIASIYFALVFLLAAAIPQFPWIISRGFSWYAAYARSHLLPALVAIAAALLLLKIAFGHPALRPARDLIALYTPVLRGLEMNAMRMRFLRVLESATRAGLTLPEVLELAAPAVGNTITAIEVLAAADRARQLGGRAMLELPFLRPTDRHLLATAIDAGRIDQAAARLLSDARQEFQTRTAVARLASIIALYGLAAAAVAAAAVIGWLNIYGAMAERAGVADLWNELLHGGK